MRILVCLAIVGALVASSAQAAVLRHATGASELIRGYDKVHYEDWEAHPFDVSIRIDVDIEVAVRPPGSTPGLGSADVLLAPAGEAADPVHVLIYSAAELRDAQGSPEIVLHGIGLDAATYDVTIYGLDDAEIQISRSPRLLDGGDEVSVDAQGSSSFALADAV